MQVSKTFSPAPGGEGVMGGGAPPKAATDGEGTGAKSDASARHPHPQPLPRKGEGALSGRPPPHCHVRKWALIGLGSLAGVAALAAAYWVVTERSDAVLE